jgi:hypothetical protein
MVRNRPALLLSSFGTTAVAGAVLAAVFDEEKGWNHPGQAVANVAWITMLVAVLAFIVTGVALLARTAHGRSATR